MSDNTPRKLAIFDVDGTLLDNMETEDACYSAALREVLELPSLDTDWTHYEHVSDAAIAVEAYRRHHGSAPSAAQLDATMARFVRLLAEAHDTGSGVIRPTNGTPQLFDALARHGWAVAIATGAWRRASELKMSAGGLRYAGVPMATSEDGPARASIVSAARVRAERLHGVERFDRVVSIGDGLWDVLAARDLGLPFVGIGSGPRANALRAAGVGVVLEDYTDIGATVAALESATVLPDARNERRYP
jgi:phosphoglycolate phosphatase-like HAD superfamily hydrolase